MQVVKHLMIHEENYRPIRVQNSSSHGSRGPHSASNQHIERGGTWKKDNETHGSLPEKIEDGEAQWAVGRPPWSADQPTVTPTI